MEAKVEDTPGAAGTSVSDNILRQKVDALENQLAELTASKNPVAVAGGFNDLGGLQATKEWVEKTCTDLRVPLPVDCYTKGDFAGLVFLKFGSADERDRTITKIRAGKYTIGDRSVWIRCEVPIAVRAVEKFLFGLKKQLIAWGFGTKEIRVDIEDARKTLKFNSVTVATAHLVDAKIHVEWSPEWRDWKELQESGELQTLFQQSHDMLSRASGGKGKGKTKGNQ